MKIFPGEAVTSRGLFLAQGLWTGDQPVDDGQRAPRIAEGQQERSLPERPDGRSLRSASG